MSQRIFISYSKQIPEPTEQLARFLENRGYAVWWDTDIKSGESFRKVIDRELDAADAVVVIWSAASITSEWVASEADHAREQSKLVTTRTADARPSQFPKPYSGMHADLVSDHAAVLAAIERVIASHRPSRDIRQPASHPPDPVPLIADLPPQRADLAPRPVALERPRADPILIPTAAAVAESTPSTETAASIEHSRRPQSIQPVRPAALSEGLPYGVTSFLIGAAVLTSVLYGFEYLDRLLNSHLDMGGLVWWGTRAVTHVLAWCLIGIAIVRYLRDDYILIFELLLCLAAGSALVSHLVIFGMPGQASKLLLAAAISLSGLYQSQDRFRLFRNSKIDEAPKYALGAAVGLVAFLLSTTALASIFCAVWLLGLWPEWRWWPVISVASWPDLILTICAAAVGTVLSLMAFEVRK